MKYDVFGLGNPLIDVIIPVNESALEELALKKASMNLVDQARQKEILAHCRQQTQKEALGGSCGNSMVMIAQLGGKSAFLGNAGQDHFGKVYEKQLQQAGVSSYLHFEEGMTGTSVILVTPDGERTMNTHLGKCQDLNPKNLNLSALGQSSYLYIEGYLWDTPSQQEAVMTAVKTAKQKEVKIALSLSDSFCVERNKVAFQMLLRDYVDLVFCNQAEGRHMTGLSDPAAILTALQKEVDEVALTLGSQGAQISKKGNISLIEPFPTKAVDTTGAGDSFAAGYLFGITQGLSAAHAGRIGSKAASLVVGQMGPRFEGDLKTALNEVLP